MMNLRDDLYIIPVENGNIIYSPLRRGVFWANIQASNTVRLYLAGNKIKAKANPKVHEYLNALSKAEVFMPIKRNSPLGNRLVIILSQICNLACTYCYAQESRSKEIISKDKLKVAYDTVLADKNNYKCFSFIGGGEPLVTWDIIEWSVKYIDKAKSPKHNVSYNITTNATLLNEDILDFCRKNKIHISISFDIIKSIQDVQRPFYKSKASTFDIIHHNIKCLIKHGISFGIRSTITQLNIHLMPDMVNFIASNYPTIKRVHFEQVTDPEQNHSLFYSSFIDYFFKAREIGKQHGIDVYNSISNSIFKIKERFCNGETCITPIGSIVACHRVSSIKEKYYEIFNYGQISNKRFLIDHSRYQSYINFANSKRAECTGCFAYWHCAGICSMERLTLSKEQLKAKCEFTKEIIKRILLEVINRHGGNSMK